MVGTAVVVTGAASGIGRACASALAAVGRPVALWDRDGDAVQAAATELGDSSDVATLGVQVDVTDTGALAEATGRSREALGPIGGLVHAAGVLAIEPVDAVSEASWDAVLDVNLRAHALLVQALLAELRATAPGSAVVGIASIEALLGQGHVPAYCASKAGLLGLTRSLAHHLAADGIRVNAVCPGYTDTPMLSPVTGDPDLRAVFEARVPLGRFARPEDIAAAVRFLLSDDAAYVTGTQLVVDGGFSAVDNAG